MLQKLRQVAREGGIRITHAYLAHIKKDEDRKVLAHAEALPWDEADPSVRTIFEQYLFQAVDGEQGEVNFPCMYTGEVISVSKVAPAGFDQLQNRPAVEILEAIAELEPSEPGALIALGNALSYKVMAAGTIKNHLVGILQFQFTPVLDAQPIRCAFATVADLDDREESLFDEMKGKFVTQMLNNVIKRGAVSRAAFFPCLDEEGSEMADLLVYAGSGAGSWFKALEATRRFSPRREGQVLVRMITEQNTDGDVPHDLFRRMGEHLLDEAVDGLRAESVATSVERAVGHGIDRRSFLSRWESSFGDMAYRPTYGCLFGGSDEQKPTRLKMQAGEIQITFSPEHLEHFRQVSVGEKTVILFEVPERAKVVVGKELDLKIKPVSLENLRQWLVREDE